MELQPSIAIIGAGPGGLVFARLLELGGITDYVIYERDESATPGPWQQGGTLDLHGPSGQLALKRAGLFDKFSKDLARWEASGLHIVDSRGATVVQMDEGSNRPEIDRVQLRQLLLDSVPAHKIRWGHAVSAVERNADSCMASGDNGSIIHFVNGSSVTGFRLIVGADGAWSKVRPLLTSAKPVYSGKMFIEGSLSHNNPIYKMATEMVGLGNMAVLGNGIKMAVQQVSNGTYRVYFGLPVPEDFYHHRQPSSMAATDPISKAEAVRQLLLSSNDFYATWAPELKCLVETTEGPFRAWPLYRMEPESVGRARDAAPGVTLLGDAAHLPTPFAGEGVNCSMYDAVMLADHIIEQCGKDMNLVNMEGPALETVLTAYEEDMFLRGRDVIRRGTKSETMLFAQDAAALFLKFFE
ncbi:FAD/NAD(P)-binding domain-containing protein [Aspergillus pseudotamarii]|uniref:FAD/NAD(P)-binding domain-containing protein n=1 Tax=Aspergillus pseudotamarii TaxID=132259 RepID=A0A5N6SG58_ASPPS|nr:FAD/NAD(P)-binding domain-containing protein [Aspergillus pseudotamarii]KAE8133688.1 FAD/NAD(P)-binding domain-containing protein [Aspergillus pseudotamarii]